jgi:hypothetical protein
MADNSNQSFLNTLFQWTVKSTAEEAAATANLNTTTDPQPMNEEVNNLYNEYYFKFCILEKTMA